MVSSTKTINLLDLVGLELDVCEQLDMKVDLLTENAVNNAIRPNIEKDIRWIWEWKKKLLTLKNKRSKYFI